LSGKQFRNKVVKFHFERQQAGIVVGRRQPDCHVGRRLAGWNICAPQRSTFVHLGFSVLTFASQTRAASLGATKSPS